MAHGKRPVQLRKEHPSKRKTSGTFMVPCVGKLSRSDKRFYKRVMVNPCRMLTVDQQARLNGIKRKMGRWSNENRNDCINPRG